MEKNNNIHHIFQIQSTDLDLLFGLRINTFNPLEDRWKIDRCDRVFLSFTGVGRQIKQNDKSTAENTDILVGARRGITNARCLCPGIRSLHGVH